MITTTTDTTLVAGALTSPLWTTLISTSLNWYVMAAGAVLLTLRIVQIIYDIREKAKNKDDPT